MNNLGVIQGLPELKYGACIITGTITIAAFDFACLSYVMRAAFDGKRIRVFADEKSACDTLERYLAMAYDKKTNPNRTTPISEKDVLAIRRDMTSKGITKVIFGAGLFNPQCDMYIHVPHSDQAAKYAYNEIKQKETEYIKDKTVHLYCLPEDVVSPDFAGLSNPVIQFHGSYVRVNGTNINVKYHGSGILTNA